MAYQELGHIRMFIPVTMSMKYKVFLSAQNHPNEMEWETNIPPKWPQNSYSQNSETQLERSQVSTEGQDLVQMGAVKI